MKKLTAYLLLISLLAASCSIEKRHYRKGFHIERHRIFSAPISDNDKKVTAVMKNTDSFTIDTLSSDPVATKALNSIQPENHLTNETPITKDPVIELKSKPEEDPGFVQEDIITTKAVKSSVFRNTTGGDSEMIKLIIGLLLIFVGLSPFGVLLMVGKGKEFTTNLVLWLGALLFVIVAFVAIGATATGGMFFLFFLFALIAGGLALMAVIHGIIVFVQNI